MSWLIVHNVPGREYGYRAIIDRDGFTICEPSPMGEANAALIAAAPDMYDMLKRVRAAIARQDGFSSLNGFEDLIDRVINSIEGV